jgi:hypothetical protein
VLLDIVITDVVLQMLQHLVEKSVKWVLILESYHNVRRVALLLSTAPRGVNLVLLMLRQTVDHGARMEQEIKGLHYLKEVVVWGCKPKFDEAVNSSSGSQGSHFL